MSSSKLVQVVPETVVPTTPPLSISLPEHDVSSPRPQPAQIEENQITPCPEDPPITLHEDIYSPAPVAPRLSPKEQTTESIVASTSAEIAVLSHTGSPVIEHGVPSPTQTEDDQTVMRLEDPPVDIHEDIRSPNPDITPSPLNEQPANPLPLPTSDEHPDTTVESLPQDNPTPTTTPSPANEQQTNPLPSSADDEHPDTTVGSFPQDNRRSPTPDVIPLLNEQQTDPPPLSTGDVQPDTIADSLPQDNRNDGSPSGAELKSHELVPPPSIFVEPEQSGPELPHQVVDSSPHGDTDVSVPAPIPKNAHDTDDTDTEPSLTPPSIEAPTPHESPVLPPGPALNETFPIISPTHPEAVEAPAPHPLIAQLAQTRHRYDDLKHTFETRLSDYTEDARVELEIRIADEELLARGFETILSIPGALSHSSTSTGAGDDSPPSQTEVEAQIEAFVSGAEPSVQRSLQTFTRKLTDVQHDIAALKRTIQTPTYSDAAAGRARKRDAKLEVVDREIPITEPHPHVRKHNDSSEA
ncbi:hypothetical protein BD779DRAFT_1675431 [Infundibulicybe gibba]|nr:hypothetical protein BD779DRAFT_1675431 [Infundibulicybe gibba]